ncbi:trichohyalin [Eurytemora carolleeae]|uniref:trichohyalin n=1 Tax=Eurytemora carolleeae TaxID=1294199 RepID=UPI000C778FF6|nr:trichohyalin [Eurytemora carolleeae]|eukprot:XP_023347544.1 trichohyalin-like [Eurytemora affinis]
MLNMETDYLELKSKYKKLRRENRDLKSASFEQSQHLGVLNSSIDVPFQDEDISAPGSGFNHTDFIIMEQERLELNKMEQERMEQKRMEHEIMEQERTEQERIKQERMEQEIVEQERMEQEKTEQERIEQERMEQEKMEKERMEQERTEQERIEQERIKQERIEQERMEQERIEQGRIEQERMEHERMEQERTEQERIEQERMEQERVEQERIEQERMEHERMEKERVEQERIEQERTELERIEQEKMEHERMEQETMEQERMEQERMEREKIEQERMEQERIEQERIEKKRVEQERMEKEKIENELKKDQESIVTLGNLVASLTSELNRTKDLVDEYKRVIEELSSEGNSREKEDDIYKQIQLEQEEQIQVLEQKLLEAQTFQNEVIRQIKELKQILNLAEGELTEGDTFEDWIQQGFNNISLRISTILHLYQEKEELEDSSDFEEEDNDKFVQVRRELLNKMVYEPCKPAEPYMEYGLGIIQEEEEEEEEEEEVKVEVDKEDKIKNDIKDNEEGHKFKSVDVENFKNKDEVTKDTETGAEKKSEETLEHKDEELDGEHKDEELDEEHKDEELDEEHKNEELDEEHKDEELDEEHKVTNKSEKVYLKDKSTSEDSMSGETKPTIGNIRRKSGIKSMFRSIAFDMSEDTEESFEIPEDDQYRIKTEEEEIQEVEQSPTRNSLSKEFLDRKSKMKVYFPSTQISTDSSSDNVCEAGKEEMSSFESVTRFNCEEEEEEIPQDIGCKALDNRLDTSGKPEGIAETEVQRRNSMFEDLSSLREDRPVTTRLEQRRSSLLAEPLDLDTSKKRWSLSIRHDMMETLRSQMDLDSNSVFPTLSSDFLESLDLLKEGPGVSKLSDQELENKFALLNIAISKDRYSLGKRLNKHETLRKEQESLSENLLHEIKMNLSGLLVEGGNSDFIETIGNLQKEVQVLQHSISRLASTAEAVGAVKVEDSVAYAVEVYIRHIEKLRALKERDERELYEYRRILNMKGKSEDDILLHH